MTKPMDNNVVNIFERIDTLSRANPDAVIVKDSRGDYTWQDLLNKAWGYVALLDENQARSIVPVMIDRSFESVAAMLGVLLSGRTFSPLLSSMPVDRLKSCVEGVEANVLIYTDPSSQKIFDDTLTDLKVVFAGDVETAQGGARSFPSFDPEKFFYILFTSGSTGAPKGVVLDFANIENTMRWGQETFDWQPNDVVGCVSSFSFDISMFDFMCVLYYGVTLAIFSRPEDPHFSMGELEKFQVTSIFSVPAFFSRMVEYDLIDQLKSMSLRRIMSGGDFFPTFHLLAWQDRAPKVDVFNVWGPTETSIVNTAYRVTKADRDKLLQGQFVSVGRATARMRLVLLDEEGKQVLSAREKGEICMLGRCVSRGYLNVAPSIQDSVYFNFEGQQAFRTQDIGYFDEAQNLYVVGRKGSTIKIRGFRVDLAEVERASETLPGVSIAGAFVKEILPEIKEIWICIEKNKGIDFDVFEFKQALRKMLPVYMIPKRVFPVDRLPRNENGKINRLKLSEMAEA